MSRLQRGAKVPELSLISIQGIQVQVPNPSTPWPHIQFRRFAGCPICNLHLRTVMKRHTEIEAAGIRELVFFHSKAEDMQPYQGDLPFDCVADPEKRYYQLFGVETSLLGTLHPKNLIAAIKGMRADHAAHLTQGDDNGHLGMPADFLIDAQGRIVQVKYGTYADDQWSVDELLAMAKAGRP